MPETPDAVPQTTLDAVLGGRARLRQPVRGYRAGMDAALLAAALDLKPGMRALEAGCGVGAALVQAALRYPQARFLGVERDLEAVELARANLLANGLGDRTRARCGDVAEGFRLLAEPRFDAAFANPPFFDDERAIRGPAPTRRGAWIADAGLGAWTAFLLDALREGGTVTLIHRADRLGDLLTLLAERAGSIRVRPVQPFADAPAKRVLVHAMRGGRAPLALLPALVLHPRDSGGHIAETDAILRGDAALGW